MIQHIWSILCERSIIDDSSNNISLLNVIEELTLTPPPGMKAGVAVETGSGVVPFNYEIASLWTREKSDKPELGRAKIMLIDPFGKSKASNEVELDLRSYERLRTRQRFNGLPMSGVGQYTFLIQLQGENGKEWIDVARVPLQVKIGHTTKE